MIEIRLLNKRLLQEYIYSAEYSNLKHIPITKHRAWSQIHNPRSGVDDILLLLAYEDQKLVGYLGVLPDKILINAKFERCGWLSCIWIDKEHRGKQIAFKLVQKGMEVWDGRILATEFTGPAKRLYDKTNNFAKLSEKKGIRLYVRLDLHGILPIKNEVFRRFKSLLKTFDFVSNSLLDLRFYFFRNQLSNIQFEYINHIDEETDNFIKSKQENNLFRRQADELNWIIKNPWILSSPAQDSNSKKYHFSSLDKRFMFVPIKILDANNDISAFIVFARRNDHLKIPYFFGDDLELIVKVINYHLVKWRVKTFTTFNEKLALYLKSNNTPSLFKKEMKRNYIISTIFDFNLLEKNIEIQDGDADCSFT